MRMSKFETNSKRDATVGWARFVTPPVAFPPLPWGLNIAEARLWRAFYLRGALYHITAEKARFIGRNEHLVVSI